jgi:hypothetical protein
MCLLFCVVLCEGALRSNMRSPEALVEARLKLEANRITANKQADDLRPQMKRFSSPFKNLSSSCSIPHLTFPYRHLSISSNSTLSTHNSLVILPKSNQSFISPLNKKHHVEPASSGGGMGQIQPSTDRHAHCQHNFHGHSRHRERSSSLDPGIRWKGPYTW